MASRTLLLAKRLGDVANEANATGDHRTAARLYMHAVLALTGALPLLEDAEVIEESVSREPHER